MIPGLGIERGPLTAEWVTLDALAGERFDVAEDYFSLCQRLYAGLDRRGQGAFLIGGIAYCAAAVLAWFELRGEPLPDLSGLGLRVNDAVDGLGYRLMDGEQALADASTALETALLPLVLRLRQEARISEGAQWRLVADAVAAAYQEVGEALGCGDLAREQALATIARGRTANPQTGYHRLVVDGREHHYLKRGGCCRWYTAEDGAYCASCVMRSPGEQVAEIRRTLVATQ